jgi:hypothetical protein
MQKENEAIMQRMQQSDSVLCTNLEFLHFSTKRENDLFQMSSMNLPLPMKVRDVEEEYKMWTQTYGTRTRTCPKGIQDRFGNNKKANTSVWNIEPSIPLCGGYECLSPAFNETSIKQGPTKKMFDTVTKRK